MRVPPLYIIERTAKFYGVSVGEILGNRRSALIDEARRVAIGVTCEVREDLPFSVISKCFRGRDHSTIIKTKKRARRQYESDQVFRDSYDQIVRATLCWEPPRDVASVFAIKERV